MKLESIHTRLNSLCDQLSLNLRRILVFCTILSLAACNLEATPNQPESVIPSPRNIEHSWMSIERWYHMHAEDVGIARGEADLLFIGDSITEGWPDELMQAHFGQYRPVNFGIGGDQTENLLWRLQNGSAGKLEPKVVSLLIGVNNFNLRGDTPDEVYQGIVAVIAEIRNTFPNASIIVHGIFPHKESSQSPEREAIRQVNRRIEQLADNEQIYYLDLGPQLVEPNGDISADIMPDFLHLSEEGYQIWAKALTPVLEQLFAEP